MSVLPFILELHAEDAAFLWSQRTRAVYRPDFNLSNLVKLDRRLEANLDGLCVAGDAGWDRCQKEMESDAGAFFAAAVLAVDGDKAERIRRVVEVGAAAPKTSRALISALGWLPYGRVQSVIEKLCASAQLPLQRVGIAAAAAHRVHPNFTLARSFPGADAPLQARILKAIGEFGATDAGRFVSQQLTAPDPAVRFWAAWAGTLVYAEPAAQTSLVRIAEEGGPFAVDAARLVVRRLEPPQALRLWQTLARNPARWRIASAAAGAFGDPEAVPWLIEQLRVPALARVAGEALSLLTGVHLINDKLDGKKPDGFEAGPNDNPDDNNVAMDPDDNLPWPDADLVAQWWQTHQQGFKNGTRYLLGKPLSPQAIQHALRHGGQRQREAAALELALAQKGAKYCPPLFEVRAPGFRQLELLSQKVQA